VAIAAAPAVLSDFDTAPPLGVGGFASVSIVALLAWDLSGLDVLAGLAFFEGGALEMCDTGASLVLMGDSKNPKLISPNFA
jgi:hypothetical protein